MPWVFVLIWSTGFVVARFGMPHSPPMSFLALRYALSLLCFVGWISLAGVEWPRGREQWLHLAVVGVLIHAAYLGGVWSAVKAGLGAGTVALLVGLQPVLTANWTALITSTATQMTAIPFLLYDGPLFGVIDSRLWGTVLIVLATLLTIWSMVYYLQRALPEIRAKAR